MNDNVTRIVKQLTRAAWAPVAVLVIHALVAKTRWRMPLDFTMHFLGGAAIAWFLYQALDALAGILGKASPFGRNLYSFALACTVGVFWEFGELFSDYFLHTHIQISVHETLGDLIADTLGAITALLVAFLLRRLARPCNAHGK